VNVPVGVLALVAAALVVPHAWGQRRPRLDPLGALGISLSIALALVPLTLGRDEGWPPWTWASLAAALPVLGLTLWWERRLARRGGEPLIDLPLFRDRKRGARGDRCGDDVAAAPPGDGPAGVTGAGSGRRPGPAMSPAPSPTRERVASAAD
jgi:hypothetical protein